MPIYRVKNINHPNWRDRKYKYMVIRDCRAEKAPNDGFWFYGIYCTLEYAYETAKSLNNGLLVEAKDVKPFEES